MKKQVYNPFLPVSEYIPDVEAHVFGDRVYLYGSHDKERGETFCMLPYVVWSAPVDDLSNWTNKGISYEAKQDPLYSEARPYLYAPDCVRGNDGRFYLYYCLAGYKGAGGYDGPISVAVCDTPDGKFEFYGVVSHEDGTPFNDVVLFDPAVINDDGQIRLYFGACYPFENYGILAKKILERWQTKIFNRSLKEIRSNGGVMGAFTTTLADDMLTVTSKPVRLFPVKTRGTQWAKHPFFEASSIRKINGMYYFVYSSQRNHELCYATSKYPDRDFIYRGVIVSNGDVGYMDRKEKDRVNHTGTNHGSIEQINGKWYVFYHRQTHGSDYSRQVCAEQIFIKDDGTIDQVEITSCGLNGGPLKAEGYFPATICCNLTNGHMPRGGYRTLDKRLPMIMSENKERFLGQLAKGTRAVYKFFDLTDARSINIKARGRGILTVYGNTIHVDFEDWMEYHCQIQGSEKTVLCFEVTKGKIDILSFEFECINRY
jgi:arabinoxylan arabinofuranohydrolase